MFKKTNALVKLIQRWVLPFTCILCRRPSDREQDLCRLCLNDLPIVAQKCPRCAQPVGGGRTCGACLQNPPPFTASVALFDYAPPVTALILNLKFHHNLACARILGELLAETITREYHSMQLPDVIVPVPLHITRLKERGFNQALEIARPVAKKLRLTLSANTARRIKNTQAQMKLPADKRHSNVKNAFIIDGNVYGKHIAILDDVMTTGSTMCELSLALLKKGATRIDAWCCARA